MKQKESIELPLIRPPSESRSLLLRVTRSCHWNRCRFCGIYPALGEKTFSRRCIEEIIADIEYLSIHHPEFKTLFIGDADPLQIGLDKFCYILQYIHKKLPQITRITCYARVSTLYRIGSNGIKQLANAGLNRVHIGLETGSKRLLVYHRKGHTPSQAVEVTEYLKNAKIEISFYVLLGLGGSTLWKEHISETANILNITDPDFIRIRRLWIFDSPQFPASCPLVEELKQNRFKAQTPEGYVLELKTLLESLDNNLTGYFTCDHANNYIAVHGRLPYEKTDMLKKINEFLKLPEYIRNRIYSMTVSRI